MANSKIYNVLCPIIWRNDIPAFHKFMTDISDYTYAKQFNDFKEITIDTFNEKYINIIAQRIIYFWNDHNMIIGQRDRPSTYNPTDIKLNNIFSMDFSKKWNGSQIQFCIANFA